MDKNKFSITFACYNALPYTKLCIESMVKHGTPLDRLIVVDNGSKDGTRAYLETLPLGARIFNRQNLGCGVAWNQGALAMQSEWTIIMNNDVLVSPSWIENLIAAAELNECRVVSPAMIEGDLDYDFDLFATDASHKMKNTIRNGTLHGVCLAVHNSVWLDVGYFRPTPKLLGYEDTLFFHDLQNAGIKTATLGASWLHHYGSITQKEMLQEKQGNKNKGLGYRYNYRLLNKSWLRRKLDKIKKQSKENKWRKSELQEFSMTIRGIRENGKFRWI